jgi:hypothetical protein
MIRLDAGARTDKQDISHADDSANQERCMVCLSPINVLQQMRTQMKKVDHDFLNIFVNMDHIL